MGIENNEAIIATTWNKEVAEKTREWIRELPTAWQQLFAIIPSIVNHKQTIIFAPDGSKKGWDIAEQGQRFRNEFFDLLKSFDYDDGSSPLDFIEVGYGEFGQKVLRGNCKNCYSDADYAE